MKTLKMHWWMCTYITCENSNVDEKLKLPREKKEQLQKKKKLCTGDDFDDTINCSKDGVRQGSESSKIDFDTDKVFGYESDYFSSYDPGSYI